MKFIYENDETAKEWHVIDEEMPPRSAHVKLLRSNGTIVNAEIVVEMSGFYVYLHHGWGSLSDYTHWKYTDE